MSNYKLYIKELTVEVTCCNAGCDESREFVIKDEIKCDLEDLEEQIDLAIDDKGWSGGMCPECSAEWHHQDSKHEPEEEWPID